MGHPCAANPELWFGYPDDDGGDGAAKARAYERSATEARLQCLRRCPLAQQRRCAQHAIAHREEYGVWAGVKLPGGQYRKRDQLAHAHDVLRRIASGKSTPGSCPRTRRCWRGTNTRRSRWPRSCCICRWPRSGLVRPPDLPAKSQLGSLLNRSMG